MDVEIKIDPAYPAPKLVVLTASVTEEIVQLVEALSKGGAQVLLGNRGGRTELLEQEELIRVYASGGKVLAATGKGEYELRLRLYELEELLDARRFVRISNSEIVNLKAVDYFDLNLAGTICVKLSNGTVTYVSRRYVAKVKQRLGI